MLRTALLWGNTITLDADLSKYIETVSDQWVIEGLEVSSNSVAPGKAWVKATRSNGETIMTLVQNTEALSVDTSGTKKIWLEIRQEAIDNGLLNNEDWTWIASIKTWPTLPSQNFLLLASVAENIVKDERNLIPKIQSVAQKTSVLEEKMTTAEGQISQLAEAGAVDHLEESGIVGEKYTLENQLFKQYTPKAEDSTVAINIGENDKNKEIHIQRVGSWSASNQLKLKLKKFWAPTTSVIVEVRKWIKVDVNNKEAYRYGWEVIASTAIAYTEFTTDWQEKTITFNNRFWGTKWELLDIVVYQQDGTQNSTDYYQIACHATQYSEAFSYVSVNGSSRVREKLMPYCISEGFAQILLCKVDAKTIEKNNKQKYAKVSVNHNGYPPYNITLLSLRGINGKVWFLCHTTWRKSSRDKQVSVYIENEKWEKFAWGKVQTEATRWENTLTFDEVDFHWDELVVKAYSEEWEFSFSLEIEVSIKDLYFVKKTGVVISPIWNSIIWVGQNIKHTLLWLHYDWTRIARVWSKTKVATMWTIPPWNFVGYADAFLADWTPIKVPYYSQ